LIKQGSVKVFPYLSLTIDSTLLIKSLPAE